MLLTGKMMMKPWIYGLLALHLWQLLEAEKDGDYNQIGEYLQTQ